MRVVIVSGEAQVRDALVRSLAAGGFDLEIHADATSAAIAVEGALSADCPFAVAFVDVGDDGCDGARRLRALDEDLNLILIGATDAQHADPIEPADKLFLVPRDFAAVTVAQMATALCRRWSNDRALIATRAQLRIQVLLLEERRRDLALAERRAVHSATHDSLTGAPNRLAFLDALEQRVTQPGRFATVMVDLDRFKLVNDTLGHLAGDALIRAMYAVLVDGAPAGALVARLGGDEFGILFDTAGEQTARAACARIVAACAVPVRVLGTTVQSGASAGLVVADGLGEKAMEMVRRADQALNAAKRRGRGGVQAFDAGMDHDLRIRRQVENDLRQALARDELDIAFQPIVESGGLEPAGFEALLRWTHPERGPIAPAAFLPVAEESNLIHALGDWVIDAALAQARRWPGQYVAVNVSPRQFRRQDFAGCVAERLRAAGVAGSRLQIEITEAALADDPERAAATLQRLRALGCRIALDDFGTGACHLGGLRSLALDAIKIDGSFVRACGRERDAAAVVHALVQLGRALRVEVVAEGVETAEQVQALRIAGASHLQGWFLGRPADAAATAATAIHRHDLALRTGTDG